MPNMFGRLLNLKLKSEKLYCRVAPCKRYCRAEKYKKTASNMETEKYTIHSHIHQYAPTVTVGLRRTLLAV